MTDLAGRGSQRWVLLVAAATVVLVLIALAAIGGRDDAGPRRTTPQAQLPLDRRPRSPGTAPSVGGAPSLTRPPAGLPAGAFRARLRFVRTAAGVRCGGRLDDDRATTVATLVCSFPSAHPVAVWATFAHRRPRFLGYPLVDPDGRMRTALPIADHRSANRLLVTNDRPGHRGRSPGHVLASARL